MRIPALVPNLTVAIAPPFFVESFARMLSHAAKRARNELREIDAARVPTQLFLIAEPVLRAGNPTVVANPQLVVFNKRLAEDLGLEPNVIEREAAAMLSGNQLPDEQTQSRWPTQGTSSVASCHG